VRAFAADVGNREKDIAGQFMLYAQVPLLHVGPLDSVRDGDGSERAGRPGGSLASSNTWVPTWNVADGSVRREGRCALLEKFGVGFVAVHVLEEDAISPADGPFAVTDGIVGEAEARPWIDPLVFKTARRAWGYTRDGGF